MELSEIKGIGAKRLQALNGMGIFTPSDLLLRFPDKYVFTDVLLNVNLRDGVEVSFLGEVVSPAKRAYIRRGLNVVNCSVKNNGVNVRCSWFNQPFAARNLAVGDKVYVVGKVKKFKNSIQLINPILIAPQADDSGIIPVYKTAVPSRTFASAVKTALNNIDVHSYIPTELAVKFGLPPLKAALTSIHFPQNKSELDGARCAVAVENMCYVITSYRMLKNDKRDFIYGASDEVVTEFVKSLPYRLTRDQLFAVDKIINALRSDKLANMLVQGEVGCGKTVIALAAMFFAAKSGFQAALMAPTEVLARQHYSTMIKILEPLGVKTQLLCASMTAKQRESALFNIKYGAVGCVVGTQSLIGEDIEYNDLRLVIVDEQQRFGVNQRAKLENKGLKTDTIVMTATPIPRTLALSLYGELQQITVRSLPDNRPVVHTSVVPNHKIDDMYKYIIKKAECDERTYIICPRIESDDDEQNSVENVYAYLKKTSIAPYLGCVHGKMRDADKNAAMTDFKNGKIKVLVSTTVVEVGIDVPEATTVAVYDADRFGLSQLHQIRGRVGRGTKESYCFLLSDSADGEGFDRLKKFCSMTDGFSVSELDFKLRGAGDFVGLRQHGSGSLDISSEVIERSRELSDALIDGGYAYGLMPESSSSEFIRSVTLN